MWGAEIWNSWHVGKCLYYPIAGSPPSSLLHTPDNLITTMTTSSQLWQDSEVRVDVPASDFYLHRGEFEIICMGNIDNRGEKGRLSITNRRMMWQSVKVPSINLSIGYDCILQITLHSLNSQLHVVTKFQSSKVEFNFANEGESSPCLFTVQAVHRAYHNSKLNREVKLRGNVVRDRELSLLPQEQLQGQTRGVWNLSSHQHHHGSFCITNIRFVWFADEFETFNISVPYLRVRSICTRECKLGPALVIETTPESGGYVLAFKFDPPEQLQNVHDQVLQLHKQFSENPVFGFEFNVHDLKKEKFD